MKITLHKSLLFLGISFFLFIFLVGNNSSAFGSSVISETKLTASDGTAYDFFGNSVSISDDTAVVGAVEDDDKGVDSGSAYVFRYNGSAWVQEAKLTASDGEADDYFGVSVSISGDMVVVGAYGDDGVPANSGSAYIFRYDGNNWVEEAILTASDGAEGDLFGYSVSISGDTVVVGAVFGDDNSVTDSGSAYVFVRYLDGTDYTWEQEAKLTASDAAEGDYFGYSVSISDNTVVVGAVEDDDKGVDSGSVYVFSHDGTWVEDTKLTASDAAEGDYFGNSVSISGDTVIVGAMWDDDDSVTDSGSAYVFTCEFAPTSPEEEIEDIIEQIGYLVNDGKLNKGEGNALTSKLDAATRKLNKDNTKAACNVLQAFINQINAKIRSGKLLPDDGQQLIDAASSVSVCN